MKLFSLEKRRLKGILPMCINTSRKVIRKMHRPFSVLPSVVGVHGKVLVVGRLQK